LFSWLFSRPLSELRTLAVSSFSHAPVGSGNADKSAGGQANVPILFHTARGK
jgi:hypothetical protein